MFPISIVNQYGNTVAAPPKIKKMIFYSSGPMILLSDGRLFARGQNSGQMFGDGSAANTYYTGDWRQVHSNVRDFWTEGGASIAIMNDYTVQTSGSIRGLTGGTASSTTVWTDRSSYFSSILVSNIKDIAWTPYNGYILMADGSVISGGTNATGQHGYGNTTAITSLTVNPNFVNIKKIGVIQSTGNESFYALDTSGNLYGAGYSSRGELLTSGTTPISTPKLLTSAVLDFTASGYCFLCTKSDGIYVGGSQFNGQLGDGVTSSTISNVGRTTLYKLPDFSSAPTYINNKNYMTVIQYNGLWYVTGQTNKGATGLSTTSTIFIQSPTDIPSATPTTDLGWAIGSSNTYVVTDGGLLYGCGSYSAGTDLLPGYTALQRSFVPLSTSGIS